MKIPEPAEERAALNGGNSFDYRILALLPGLLVASFQSDAGTKADTSVKTLKIYTYKSFVSDWGPGKEIKKAFEADCGCTLQWVQASDGAALWGRIKMEGAAFDGDVVAGLDSHLAAEVGRSGLLEPFPHPVFQETSLPQGAWFDTGSGLVPYQYGYYAIIYDSRKIKPFASWEELLSGAPGRSLILEDPRTSTVGLGFLSWTRSLYKDKWPAFMKRLRPKILTVARGWSDAYGLFLKGEAPMVMSYSLSEAYHLVQENTVHYKAMIFAKGHPVQVEGAGVVKTSRQKKLAKKFVTFLHKPGIQRLLAEKSWMYPVREGVSGLPKPFFTLKKPKLLPEYNMKKLGANRVSWVKAWTESMTAL